MTLKSARPPLAETEIRTRLEALDVRPHPSLIAHLRRLNGANAYAYSVSFPGGSTIYLKILGFDWPRGDLEVVHGRLSDSMLPGAVPIATDGGGNAFVVTDTGKVRFWDHDIHRSVSAFDSIADFLDALEHHPEEEPHRYSAGLDTVESLREFLQDGTPALNAFRLGKEGVREAMELVFALGPDVANSYFVGAAYFGDIGLVDDIVRRGADIDAFSVNGGTALAAAGMTSNLALADWLLSAGADPTIVMESGQTALSLARIMHPVKDRIRAAVAEWTATHDP